MRTNEDLRLFRFFTIADYEAEEAFLREQHRKGFALVRYGLPGFYYFTLSPQEDMVYRLDFPGEVPSLEAYRQFYQDYGWEYLFEVNGFHYFRKPAETAEDTELFSDNSSRIALAERIFKTRLIPLLVIFCLCFIPQIVLSIGRQPMAWSVLWVILFLVYGALFLHCGRGLLRMKRTYSSQ